MVDDKVHFIDPTLRIQAGALGLLREPDYGRALVLVDDTTGLVEMPSPQVRYRMSVNKSLSLVNATPVAAVPRDAWETSGLDVPDEPAGVSANLKVSTNKLGSWAESVRYSLESDGALNLGKAYES